MSSDTINGIITDDDVIHSGWLTKSPPQKKIKNAASWTVRYTRKKYYFSPLNTNNEREEKS